MTRPRPLKLLFFGTPEFAVPSLRRLAAGEHRVVGVISQPDRPRGRGRKLEPTPVHEEAERLGLPLLQAEKAGEREVLEWMRERSPDLGCVVAFGQFIPKPVRELPPQGLLNAHASLLPRHRGAAPIQHAILGGDTHTGISVMRVVREMDAGDTCHRVETEIGMHETAGELALRLAELAAAALADAIDGLARGELRFEAQDEAAVTLAPKLERAFGRIDWREPVQQVLRRIRAATPWPGADLALSRAGLSLRILRAQAWEGQAPPPGDSPGRVIAVEGRLGVAVSDGWVEILRLQKPGGRELDVAEYLRGARVGDDEEAELR